MSSEAKEKHNGSSQNSGSPHSSLKVFENDVEKSGCSHGTGCACSSFLNTDPDDKRFNEISSDAPLGGLLKMRLVNSVLALVLLTAGYIYKRLSPEQAQSGELLMALASLIVAFPVLVEGLKGLFSKEPKFMTEQLVSLAILASMSQGEFAAATFIPVILVFGHVLEEKSIMGIEKAVASFKKLAAREAAIVENGKERKVGIETIKVGDVVVCYPGEVIPVDGVIVEGDSFVDQATMTGESVPLEVYKGVSVFAGTANMSGKLLIKTVKLSKDFLFNRIISLLKEAEKSKAPIVKLIEKYVYMYFPFVIATAAITLFVTGSIGRAVAILVLSCPCALVLASPTAMISALVTASRNGIMIKNTAFLEKVSEIDTVVFDKTGTVTFGKLDLEEIYPFNDSISPDEVLKAAANSAVGSMHPVSAAIVGYLHANSMEIPLSGGLEEVPGNGVKSEIDGKVYYLGKIAWISEALGIKAPESLAPSHGISVWVAGEGKIFGQISFSDKPRPEMADAIAAIKDCGVKRFALLTGDKKEIGEEVGNKLGFDEVITECLPNDKLNYINKLKEGGSKVLFVGDGVNDALALKAGDVGVAMGKGGSDVSIQNSDITLNTSDMMALHKMFVLSAKTRSIINQNIFIATGFTFFMMLLASAGFLGPVAGAIVHNLGGVFVAMNSARLLKEF
ncbi:MAG: cadmium-translocating P-type ATPase [Candidatus Riflebacteria bacterium]|nr:cadmium-translocating P-type ATPase [Candidatus Riflebacteria bacterium]